MDNERTLGRQWRQAAHPPAGFGALLQLLCQQPALEGEGIEGRELGGMFPGNMEARGPERAGNRSLRLGADVDEIGSRWGRHGELLISLDLVQLRFQEGCGIVALGSGAVREEV